MSFPEIGLRPKMPQHSKIDCWMSFPKTPEICQYGLRLIKLFERAILDENDILKDYKQFNDRSVYIMGSSLGSMSGAILFLLSKMNADIWKRIYKSRKGKDIQIKNYLLLNPKL